MSSYQNYIIPNQWSTMSYSESEPEMRQQQRAQSEPRSGCKSGALALIIIGSISLAAVISLGILFAIRPKVKTTKTHLYWIGADIENRTTTQSSTFTITTPSFIPEKNTPNINNILPTNTRRILSESSSVATFPPFHDNNLVHNYDIGQALNIGPNFQLPISTETITISPSPSPSTTVTPSTQSTTRAKRPQGVTIRLGHSQAQIITSNGSRSVKSSDNTIPDNVIDSNIAPIEIHKDNGRLELWSQRSMKKYGRVVGLSYKNDLLYVPSHRNGNISILTTPDLSLVQEMSCHKCRIYDLAVLHNGDIIVAQGKMKKLTKINKSGKIEKEITLNYKTKGLAVDQNDELFVLARTHDKVYRYDKDLNEINTINFPNEFKDDCNFLIVDQFLPILYISCENQVFVVDFKGQLIDLLKPPHTKKFSYSVGISLDENGFLMVARRGKALIDVYSPDGKFTDSLGSDIDTLWSDMEVRNGYAYVIDYISSTIKTLKIV